MPIEKTPDIPPVYGVMQKLIDEEVSIPLNAESINDHGAIQLTVAEYSTVESTISDARITPKKRYRNPCIRESRFALKSNKFIKFHR